MATAWCLICFFFCWKSQCAYCSKYQHFEWVWRYRSLLNHLYQIFTLLKSKFPILGWQQYKPFAFCVLLHTKYKTSIDSDWYILKIEKCKKWYHTNKKHENCWMDVLVFRIYWNTWIKLLLNNFDIWQLMNENIAKNWQQYKPFAFCLLSNTSIKLQLIPIDITSRLKSVRNGIIQIKSMIIVEWMF